jgi:hypothetical protein
MAEDEDPAIRMALQAAAKHTPYGEVLLAQVAELELIHVELAEIKAAVDRLRRKQ